MECREGNYVGDRQRVDRNLRQHPCWAAARRNKGVREPLGVVVGQTYKQTLRTESAATNRRVGALERLWRRHRSRCRPVRPAPPSGMIWQLAAISQSDAELEQCKLRAPDAHLGRVSPGDFRTHIFQSRLSRFDSRGRDEDSIVIRHTGIYSTPTFLEADKIFAPTS